MQKPSWWQIFKIKLGLGHPLAPVRNLGKCDQVLIKYKDVYITLLIAAEGESAGEIVSLGWSEFVPDSPIAKMYYAEELINHKS
jgi:hypothetical protein